MGRNIQKAKGRSANAKPFGRLPKEIWEHPDYCNLKPLSAYKMLMEFACQYNGRNNGDLTAAYSVLKARGWKSQDTINNAVEALMRAGLVVRSRTGRFCNPGGRCHLYALTWLPVDECPGKALEIAPTATPLRNFSLEAIKTPSPETGDGSHQKLEPRRERDERGRYVSHQKPVRLLDTTYTRNW
ncbi:hypothetical protein [Parahaliea aestuarii]|uniref:Helix-turn-helix domain-containing protein n=1 Tax=Parahaliea aestuarii TaxID=1852021 RepID=A0A5C8ZML5_9GAMM|nr:hypothetical protein [Parahaliea aestuarii]TXS88980.1 hypothetical protein FVW59_19300 [Parahaliea aestuarii]